MKISYIISMVCLSSMVHAHTNTPEISSINAINFNQIYKEVNATPLLQKDKQSYDVAWNIRGTVRDAGRGLSSAGNRVINHPGDTFNNAMRGFESF